MTNELLQGAASIMTSPSLERTFEEFEARKRADRERADRERADRERADRERADRERLHRLTPDAAQAEADAILQPRLWRVVDPRELAWPGDLADDEPNRDDNTGGARED